MRILLISITLLLSSVLFSQPNCAKEACCCGEPEEIVIPNGNFEGTPHPSPSSRITYYAGNSFSNWFVMSGSIDHKGPSYTTLMKGNPNGPSHFIDLHGFRPGSISTNLSGLASGNTYILTLWYAKNDYASSANCNIQIGDGTWLNESWNSTNSGSDIWLQKCFTFTAKGTSAELKLIGSGPFGTGGMLLDDIKLWKCPKPKA